MNLHVNQHAIQHADLYVNRQLIHLQIINGNSSVRPKYIEEHPQLS